MPSLLQQLQGEAAAAKKAQKKQKKKQKKAISDGEGELFDATGMTVDLAALANDLIEEFDTEDIMMNSEQIYGAPSPPNTQPLPPPPSSQAQRGAHYC